MKSTVFIGGSMGHRQRAPPPQQDPILLFSHIFLPKSTRTGGQCPSPPMSRCPLDGKSWICHWYLNEIHMQHIPLAYTLPPHTLCTFLLRQHNTRKFQADHEITQLHIQIYNTLWLVNTFAQQHAYMVNM